MHRTCIVKPAFRQGVFAVVAVAYFRVAASALFFAEGPAFGRIHVPDLSVFVNIGGSVDVPQAFVAYVGVWAHNLAQG